jgi:hypothetical protein
MLEAEDTRSEQPPGPRPKPGKLDRVSPGQFVAYSAERPKDRRCRIGKIRTVTRAEAQLVVHRYRPLSDGRLRVAWRPMFHTAGVEVMGQGDTPSLETVKVQQVLMVVQLHDGGVLSHAAARSLDKAGWRLDETDMLYEADLSR